MKYKLPPNVTVKLPLPEKYNKETKLTFIDSVHGEFVSTVRSMEYHNESMHPVVMKLRQQEKFKKIAQNKWGVDNPSQNSEALKKRVANIKNLNKTVKNPEIDLKRRNTLLERYGVTTPLDIPGVREHIIQKQNLVKGSSEEDELRSFIESLGLATKKGYFGGKKPCEVDIKVEEKRIAFEYNGLYWHCIDSKNKRITRQYHLNKTLKAVENNY